jgi:hypothetical protein
MPPPCSPLAHRDADRSITELRHLGIEFVNADWTLAHEAGGFKSKYKMSYADCFAAALTKQKKALLLTGDPEFKQVETQIVIDWLSRAHQGSSSSAPEALEHRLQSFGSTPIINWRVAPMTNAIRPVGHSHHRTSDGGADKP